MHLLFFSHAQEQLGTRTIETIECPPQPLRLILPTYRYKIHRNAASSKSQPHTDLPRPDVAGKSDEEGADDEEDHRQDAAHLDRPHQVGSFVPHPD